MTTVLPFTTCVTVLTVAPEPPDVATAPVTCGALDVWTAVPCPLAAVAVPEVLAGKA